MNRALVLAVLFAFTLSGAAVADPPPDELPAKTALRFHLTETISSDHSISGQPLAFVMLDPIVLDGRTIVAAGTPGAGTLILAGHAGTSGHEGDLTLRLDSVPASDGHTLYFDDQRVRINGRNKKIMSGALGFIPFAGFGARFIRGQEIQVTADTPIATILDRAATTTPAPSPAPSPDKTP
jgi:hypothetical protein